MTDFVFLGPSLPRPLAQALLPRAKFLPPIQLGDLFTLDISSEDRVLIIDGLFLHAPAVRHRELLWLLDMGVTVAGSSSMGALRAAELRLFGMRGFGRIFRLYADGEVTGDDEVAIVHGPAEDGYQAQSEPLVNVRVALADAADQGEVTALEARSLLELLSALPFRDRSYRALDLLAGRSRTMADAGRRFAAWRTTHAHDAKRQDAIALLQAAARSDPALRPHGPGDQPIAGVQTRYSTGWHAEFAGTDDHGQWVTRSQVVATIRVLHPDFPRLLRTATMCRLAGSLAVPEPFEPSDIVTAARKRGLIPPADLPAAWTWLGQTSYENADAQALALLLRAAGCLNPAAEDIGGLPAPLQEPPTLQAARKIVVNASAVARSAALTAGRTWPSPAPAGKHRPVRSPLHFRDAAVHAVLAKVWNCALDHLPDRACERGFPNLADAVAAAQPFIAYVNTFGVPSWPSAGEPIDMIATKAIPAGVAG